MAVQYTMATVQTILDYQRMYPDMRQPYGTQTLEESIIIKELEETTASGSGAAKEVIKVKLGTVIWLYKRMFTVMSGRALS